MVIERISIENFGVFDKIEIDFCEGVNVFIGENSTGKTTLLKFLYAWCNADINKQEKILGNIPEEMKPKVLKDFWENPSYPKSEFAWVFEFFRFYQRDSNRLDYFKKETSIKIDPYNPNEKQKTPSIFIPTKEMLSHTRGFPDHYEKYNLPFDNTQIDIIKNARINETRKLTPLAEKLLTVVSKIIDGEVLYENDTFYIVKTNGLKIPFSMEAEGFCKFGMIWRLLRNGLFDEPGTVLLWDEPEANLNPKLIPVLVDILLELARGGVQIFLATHDCRLARYFSLKAEKDEVMFHNLYKGKEDKAIYHESAHRYTDLKHNAIEDAEEEFGDFAIKKAIEEIENV